MQLNDGVGGLRGGLIGIGHLGPAARVGALVERVLGLGRAGVADEIALGGRFAQWHRPALVVAPEDAGHDATPRRRDVLDLAHRVEVVILAAGDGEGLVEVAVQSLAIVVRDDERAVLLRPAGGVVGEGRADLVARRGGFPSRGELIERRRRLVGRGFRRVDR